MPHTRVQPKKVQAMDGRQINETILGQNQCADGIPLFNSTTQELNNDLFAIHIMWVAYVGKSLEAFS